VSSKVIYTVTGQVKMEYTVEVKYTENHVDFKSDGVSAGKTEDGTETGFIKQTWKGSQNPGEAALNLVGENVIKLGDYTFNKEALVNDVVVYTITIENLASDQLKVKVTDNGTNGATGDGTEIISRAVTGSTLTTGEYVCAAKGTETATFTYVVTYKLVNAAANAEINFAPTFALTAVIA
ncbi:MAG: hypothetical protein SOV27_00715, partial [Eubacteriales bacterium]|nr:hypothetical protein [Eubacteriales bacterium]